MAITIGSLVWFKKAGHTPFVSGVASNAAASYDHVLGGRGKSDLGPRTPSQVNLGGVPVFDPATLPSGVTSTQSATGTFPSSGIKHMGVVAGDQPLAPKTVSTPGIYGSPTPSILFNPGNDSSGSPIDEGSISSANTVRTNSPNVVYGARNRTVATGVPSPVGQKDLTVPAQRAGRRQPSTTEGAGVVVSEVPVTKRSVSPDGTALAPGDVMYWVQWGSSAPSNPAKSKRYNRFRVSLHAKSDLIEA